MATMASSSGPLCWRSAVHKLGLNCSDLSDSVILEKDISFEIEVSGRVIRFYKMPPRLGDNVEAFALAGSKVKEAQARSNDEQLDLFAQAGVTIVQAEEASTSFPRLIALHQGTPTDGLRWIVVGAPSAARGWHWWEKIYDASWDQGLGGLGGTSTPSEPTGPQTPAHDVRIKPELLRRFEQGNELLLVSTDFRGAADLFDPARLTLAREAAGLTQTELAKRIGVTPGAISQFERGYSRPTMATVRELSLALGFPPAFLVAAEPLHPVQPSQAFFRKLASTSRREQSEACAAATLLRLFVQALERYVDLPAIDLPAVPMSGEAENDDIDRAAAAVRDAWGLGDEPIADVVREIEAHGIPVARVADIAAKVDGFSCLTFERPVVLLGQHKGDRARSRFDAAHELGHLVMHHEFRGGLKERERQAHRFASAFLAPRQVIKPLLPATVDFTSLLELKRRWGRRCRPSSWAARKPVRCPSAPTAGL